MVCVWQEARRSYSSAFGTVQPAGPQLLCGDKMVLLEASGVGGWALPGQDAAGAMTSAGTEFVKSELSTFSDPKPFLLDLMLCQPGLPSFSPK